MMRQPPRCTRTSHLFPSTALVRSMMPHVDSVNAYGLTETSSTVTILGPDDHREALASDDPAVRGRLGSVGRPVPSIELEIRGDDGHVVGPDEIGEVYVRGDQVSGEYTSHSILDADGWYATRDQGRLDCDGFLYLRGRAAAIGRASCRERVCQYV